VSQSRIVWVLKSSWKVLLPAVIILSAAFVGKLYFTQQTIPEERTQALTVDATIREAIEKLGAYVEAQEGDTNPYPGNAEWTPLRMSCGEPALVTDATFAHPTWKVLGIAPPEQTQFQYRFRADKARGFELLARTDRDCDGIFQVRQVRGKASWTGGIESSQVLVDNPGE
jgi:hypothetical protein